MLMEKEAFPKVQPENKPSIELFTFAGEGRGLAASLLTGIVMCWSLLPAVRADVNEVT